jgi:phosphatidylglycerophosphate synthase
VIFTDPLAFKLTRIIANNTNWSPNFVTFISFLLGVLAALCFFIGTELSLIAGGILYYLSFTFDCVDGKLARVKGQFSPFGGYIDYYLDHLRVTLALVGLTFGTTETLHEKYLFLWLSFISLFMYMFGHSSMSKASNIIMELQITEDKSNNLNKYKNHESPFFTRVFKKLESMRIRKYLFSGIEFQGFSFMIGPVLGAVTPFLLVSLVLKSVFDILYPLKFYADTHPEKYDTVMYKIRREKDG